MKYFYLFLFLFILSCSSNKVIKSHGVLSLEAKSEKILISKTNKNDIIDILGPPSVKSSFDENTWIYIERKKVNQSIFKIGKKKFEKNNVLVVMIDGRGMVKEKNFYKLDKMNDLEFNQTTTASAYNKDTFVYNFLSSLREKINSPVKKRNNTN